MQESYDDLPIPDEIVSLKKRADLMGISYHPSIGVEKLREKIAAVLNPSVAKEEEKEKEAPVAVPVTKIWPSATPLQEASVITGVAPSTFWAFTV